MIDIDTGTDELHCQIDGRVAVITLNRPHKKNALSDVLTPALRRTVVALEQDKRIGCVVITGAGDSFCAGGDVGGMRPPTPTAMPAVPPTKQERIDDLTHRQVTLTLRIHELDQVTIAALPGAAAGAGLSIALSCDLRVAADTAFVSTAFRNLGLSGDYGASWFLPRLVGLAKAKELFYGGQRIDAAECLRLGIFNQVFPTATFREDTLAYAHRIANGPTRALGRMKINLNRGMDQSLRDSLRLEAAHTVTSMADAEAQEAIAAFTEKRPPRFHEGQ